MAIVEESTSILTQSLAPNEEAIKIRGGAISLDVKRFEDSRLERMSMETLNGAKVESPSGRSLQRENGKRIVDIKVSYLRSNILHRLLSLQMRIIPS